MQFYSQLDIPYSPRETVFQHSKANSVSAIFLFLSLAVGGFYFGYTGGIETGKVHFPPFLAYWIAGVMALLFLIAITIARATFRSSNWIIKYNPDWIIVKYRSYLNNHFNAHDPQAFGVRPENIAWIRQVKEILKTPAHRGTRFEFYTYLDLKLIDEDIAELEEHLKRERQQEAPLKGISRTKHIHYPVKVFGEGIVRIQWNGISPNIKKTLRILGERLEIKEAVKIKKDFTDLHKSSKEDQENIILQLAERGKTIDATRLATRVFKLSTTEARKFVDELLGIEHKPLREKVTTKGLAH